jgi:heme-degrading monooxygenase HmoA
MFTRVVELTSKSGKAKELSNTINEKVLPILKKQTGFVDEAVLVSDTKPTRILGLSFWNSKEDAERYHQEQYPKIQEMLINRSQLSSTKCHADRIEEDNPDETQ